MTDAASRSGIRHAIARYRSVLVIPYVRSSVFTALLGRIPMGMLGLALILLIRQQTGSYAVAGVVSAAMAVAAGLVAPITGRLIDRYGIPRVIAPLSIAAPILWATLIVAARGGASDAVLVVVAALGGLANPPLFAAVQSLLSSLSRPHDLVETAFALEAVLQEVVFLGGPVLVAVLATVGSPTLAVAGCCVLTLVGGLLFAATEGARRFRAERSEHDSLLGALASPAIKTFAGVGFASGLIFGTLELAMPAFAGEHGSPNVSGVLLGAVALGSMIGGFWHGTRPNAGDVLIGRYLAYLWLLALALVPIAIVGSVSLMLAAALLAGFFIAPSFAAELALVSKLAPEGKTTEAFTWITLAVVLGLAGGNALSGVLVEGPGVELALITPCLFAAAAAAIAFVRRATLVAPGGGESVGSTV